MTNHESPTPEPAQHLRWPLRFTRLGLLAERLCRAFWPLWSLWLAAAAALLLGLHDTLPVELVWAATVLVVLGTAAALWWGVRAFRLPQHGDAVARLDESLDGRPLAALADLQAIGRGDAASEAVWQAHQSRMRARLARARAVAPDLKLSRFDRYGLRYVALTLLVTGLLFGSVWRLDTLSGMAPGMPQNAAVGPSWEGWVEPPAHTGRPSLYLNDLAAGPLQVPEGSEIILRLYANTGELTVAETVSGRVGEPGSAADPAQNFQVAQPGELRIDGPGGAAWTISLIADAPPTIDFDGVISQEADGEITQQFTARDDYGVVAGHAEIVLDLDRVDRRYGLTADPDPRDALVADLPMPFTGDRTEFTEAMIENFSKHPWSGLPVDMSLFAVDAIGAEGSSEIRELDRLPGRRFFDPLAAAIIEQRRDLLWSRENGKRVSQILRAVSHRPDGVFRSETDYLRLRFTIRRLETANDVGITEEVREEIAEALWELALRLEEGDLSDALERLRRAQDRLAEAIQNGANDAEIAELMQELREAMQDYMRQLAEQAQENGQELADNQNMQEITGDQLQDMLDQLQQLMQEGRMAEAQQLLEALRRMMENMQVAQGQPGGQQSPGQQAMRGLQETLRQQQGLSDDSFQQLQDQFGQQGQQGQGQPGQGQMPGGQGQGQAPSLAERQDALREMLRQQQEGLPGGGEAADAAREALDRAGRAMENAEDALRDQDLAEALDSQSEAMDELREGMRNLGREMAEQQQNGQGQQGDAIGRASPGATRDPLGRSAGDEGQLGTSEQLLQGEDVYRRARDLLDEIRRRSSDQTRPDVELDYLKRLLDRF
ncbi:MAG: TIGR02302 family protein [Pseudomonadota bacterium]